MRELKFKYVLKDRKLGRIHYWKVDIEALELTMPDYHFDMDRLDIVDRVQYTGLKDKDVKEIYEGDIVRRESMAPGGVDFLGAVIYELSGFVLENGEKSIYLFSEIDELEIIGNVYENIELLEVRSNGLL